MDLLNQPHFDDLFKGVDGLKIVTDLLEKAGVDISELSLYEAVIIKQEVAEAIVNGIKKVNEERKENTQAVIDLWIDAEAENINCNEEKSLKLKEEFQTEYNKLSDEEKHYVTNYLESIGA